MDCPILNLRGDSITAVQETYPRYDHIFVQDNGDPYTLFAVHYPKRSSPVDYTQVS